MSAVELIEPPPDCPESIDAEVYPFSIEFHPNIPIIAAGLVTGQVKVYKYQETGDPECLTTFAPYNKHSCRSLSFNESGSHMVTVGGKLIRAYDCQTGQITYDLKHTTHGDIINAVTCCGEQLVASGDDEGLVLLWDTRQRDAVGRCFENNGQITSLKWVPAHNTVLATGDDGCMSVFDCNRKAVVRVTDPFTDELTSCVVLKNDSRVAVATRNGQLAIWEWGDWDNCRGKIKAHPKQIETIVKANETELLTGACDGAIRHIKVFPRHKLINTLCAETEEVQIEHMCICPNGNLLAYVADTAISWCNVTSVCHPGEQEEDDDESVIDNDGKVVVTDLGTGEISVKDHDDDDDEEEEEEEDDDEEGWETDDSDDDKDMQEERKPRKQDKLKFNKFSAYKEQFFSGLGEQ